MNKGLDIGMMIKNCRESSAISVSAGSEFPYDFCLKSCGRPNTLEGDEQSWFVVSAYVWASCIFL